jgi:hypothetical protein
MKKTIFTYIFIFLFCLCFIIGATSAFIYSVCFDTEKYIETMDKNEYSKVVLNTVYKHIEDFGDIITLDTDDIYNLLDKDSLVEHSKNYTRAYLNSMFNGTNFSDSDVDAYSIQYIKNDLKALVEKFYETSVDGFSEEEFEIIYSYIEKQINASMKFLSSNILEKTSPIGKYAVKAKGIFKVSRLALIPAFLLLVAIVFLNFKSGLGRALYRVGATIFIPSAILFIPTWLFDGYNLGSRVIIAKSPLSVVFSSVIETIVGGFETFTGIFFAISFILILAGAGIIIKQLYNSKKTPTEE